VATTQAQYSAIQMRFQMAPDPLQLHETWLKTVVENDVKGRQVHDARIAASMRLHGIEKIITKNVKDFRRYLFLQPLSPEDVLAGMR